MFLELVIATSAAYAGTRVYRRRRAQRSFDRILEDNGNSIHLPRRKTLATLEQHVQPAFAAFDRFQDRYINPVLDEAYDTGAAIVIRHIVPRLPVSRNEQLHMMPFAHEPADISPIERKTNRTITLGTAALTINIVGALVYPPLMLLSAPGLILMVVGWSRTAYTQVVHEGKFTVVLQNAVNGTGLLLLGQYLVLAFYATLFQTSYKVVFKTRDRSRKQLVNILGETPQFVWLERDGAEVQVPFTSLQVSDTIIVHAGELIPVDGCITHGLASIDQHMLTGEAQPIEKSIGDSVYAGTIVLSGTLTIQVKEAGSETVAAKIGAVLNRTADYRSTLELRGEVLADNSVLPMFGLGAATLLLLGPTSAIAVMSCYIGSSIRFTGPLSVLNFLRVTSDHSILVKDGRALELVSKVDTVVFDKTGTLTQEQPHVGAIHLVNGYTESDVLRFAAAAEHKQTHPIARAILQEAAQRQLVVPSIDEATYEIGYGLKVQLNGSQVCVGSARFLQNEAIAIPPGIQAIEEQCHASGQSLVYVAVDDHLAGAIELHPTIRPEAKRIVQELKQRGLDLYIISGDQEQPTRRLAEEIGIDHFFAEVLPEGKSDLITRLQNEGRSVCFVGDGINDSIALKKAHVSVSLRGATTIALDTAQIILTDESLSQLVALFELAEQLDDTMRRNFLWATVPTAVNVLSVYLLGTGVVIAALFSWSGLLGGMINTMQPIIRHWKEPLALTADIHEHTDRVIEDTDQENAHDQR